MRTRKLAGSLLLTALTLLAPPTRAGLSAQEGPETTVFSLLESAAGPQDRALALSHEEACGVLAGGMALVRTGLGGHGQPLSVYRFHDDAGERYVTVRGSNPVRLTVTAGRPEFRGGTWLEP